jgi:hypothetical protein
MAPIVDLPPLVRFVGLVGTSFVVATLSAVVYRWYARDAVSEGVTLLLGVGTVALYLNTTALLGIAIEGATTPFALRTATTNVVTFLAAGLVTPAGRRLGDASAKRLVSRARLAHLERDVGTLVRTRGRRIAVTLPETIEDMEAYDPVTPETKAALAGETLTFPRGLTVTELESRIAGRLRDDYGVGHVDVEVTAEGSVTYLAVGARAAGIGPTLSPGAGAVAVRADPAFSASVGDLVAVYRRGSREERVATAEIRGVAGSIVTLALEATDAERLDPRSEYHLVTLPADPQADREFAALLRSADETMAALTVASGGALEGLPVGGLDVTVVAVRGKEGAVDALPDRGRVLESGETVYVVGRPSTLRALETAASNSVDVPPDTSIEPAPTDGERD